MFRRFRGIGREKINNHMRCFVMQPSNPPKQLSTRYAWRASAAVAAFAILGVARASAEPREAGIWIDDTGQGAVKIQPCGSKLCGQIYWLQEPMNAQGKLKTDKNNPDPGMRSRAICGLPVLGQLQQMSEGGYDNGWVYDPKVGNSYDVAIVLTTPNQLQVTGYKGMKFLGKTFYWTRAKGALPACAGTSENAADAGPAAATKPSKAKAAKAKPAPAAAKPSVDEAWSGKAEE